MMTSRLELEDIESLFTIFDGNEDTTVLAIGNLSITKDDLVTMSVVVSTRINISDVGEVVISYEDRKGSALYPHDELKEGGKKAVEEYKNRKEYYDQLVAEVKETKKNMELKLSGKGFTVVKGVFFP
jgi:hypothetical protein